MSNYGLLKGTDDNDNDESIKVNLNKNLRFFSLLCYYNIGLC